MGVLKSLIDMNKLFVVICNFYIDIVFGYVYLREFVDIVKEVIREVGVILFEFNIIGVDDGIVMGYIGMWYFLLLCEIIVDVVEIVINVYWFDGVFYIFNCDKIIFGMILVVMRINVLVIFCFGGLMKVGLFVYGKVLIFLLMFEVVGVFKEGLIFKEEFLDME